MLCKEFAEKGWCDKGSDCKERHSAGCWEFSKLGTCTTKGCKGPHILMRKETKEKKTKEKLDEGAGVRWMEDFLGDLKPEMISERKRKAIDDGGRDGFLNQDTFQSFDLEYSDEEKEEEDEVEIIETESEIIEIPLSEDEMETIPLTRPARPVQQYNDEEELDYGIDEIRALSDGEEESDEEVISSLLVH